jgi:hypothetical protein
MGRFIVATRVVTAFALLLFSINVTVLVLLQRADENRGHRLFRAEFRDIGSSTEPVVPEKAISLHDNLEPIPRPHLSTLVQGWNITGNVSWLLQFSIVGFPKTGTSTLMFHLRDHPEIHMFPHERCELSYNQHVHLIEDMYRQFPPAVNASRRFVKGIKCPVELESTQIALRNYQRYFPTTDFVVGIRHPIRWYVFMIFLCLVCKDFESLIPITHCVVFAFKRFESFYNFRLQNDIPMPPAEALIGKCRKRSNNVCTNRASFHVFLANFGKTNFTSVDELALIDPDMQKALDPVPTRRRVFLYEISQLSDPQRESQFRKDLQVFLHLQKPIDPFAWFKPGKNRTDEKADTKQFNRDKINVCEDRYMELRKVLLHHAVQASHWIRRYFLNADGVVVSSRRHFEQILQSWEIDPCV